MDSYPTILADALADYSIKATGNVSWDRELLHLCRTRHSEAREVASLNTIIERAEAERRKIAREKPDLSQEHIFLGHYRLLLYVANNIVLASQRRTFTVDAHNKDVITFLLYYFNDCPLAESVFPERGYKLHKNIMLQGGVGVGKTLLMQIFSEYLRRTNNPRFFHNVSVTQMVNYYTIHNNIDRFLYNEEGSKGFKTNPVHICLNDIGVDNRPFYGVDTTTIVHDFLHARNEIWANTDIDKRFAHLTTNLSISDLKNQFNIKDKYGRTEDRFKTYNVIPLGGGSRR